MKLKKAFTPVLMIGVGCAIAWVARELSRLVTIDIGELTYDEDPEEDLTEEVFLDRLDEELEVLSNSSAGQYLDAFKEAARRAYTTVQLPKEDVPQPLDLSEFFDHLTLAQQALDEGQTLRPEQVELLLKAEGLARRTRDEVTVPSVERSLDNLVSTNASHIVMERKEGDPDIITQDQVHIDKPKGERLPSPPPSPTAQEARLDPEWDEQLREASELDYTGGRKP